MLLQQQLLPKINAGGTGVTALADGAANVNLP